MRSLKVRPEPVAVLEWKDKKKGKTAVVGIIEYVSDAGETVVRIISGDHFAGIGAEYAFMEHKFPRYAVIEQSVGPVEINGRQVLCDTLRASNGKDEIEVFFDISELRMS